MGRSLDPRLFLVPVPVWIIGTYDGEDRPNMLAVSWAGICCSDPPCVAISLRPETYSYRSIVKQQAFTVNVPSVVHMRETDFCGLASGSEVDKFERCGLTPIECEVIHAPYVAECTLAVACKVVHVVEIGSHTQFVGEIVDIRVGKTCTNSCGKLDIKKVDPIILSPAALEYFAVGRQVGRTYVEGQEFVRQDKN